ncbi:MULTISPECIES: hypothetical protein [unclassified Streptomyces]|uniref:hypothetical protein n=1 Tax=unclassified Streptomyces TaxID=2593676 RepID=UPI002884FCB7|nr:hypothetical protein [Streptomyces sp. DSM 41633]
MTLEFAYVLSSRIAGVCVVIGSAERLVALREFSPGGVYHPQVALSGAHRRTKEIHCALLVARLLAGAVLLVSSDTLLTMGLAWSTFSIASIMSGWQLLYSGEDGSDQMLTIMGTAYAISLMLSFADGVPEAGLCFIGAQACLAYSAAGIAKLISPCWRSGDAIRGILSTRTYGARRLAAAVRRVPGAALFTSWVTMTFESLFVLAPFLPRVPLFTLLGVAVLFHASTAAVMGLNGFLWSFVATYPAIIYLNGVIAGLM